MRTIFARIGLYATAIDILKTSLHKWIKGSIVVSKIILICKEKCL